MIRFWIVLLLTISTASPVVAAEPPFSVAVRAQHQREGGGTTLFVVQDGDVLRSGDEFQIRLTSRKDQYLYVINYSSTHHAELLHPLSGKSTDARIEAGQSAVLPSRSGTFSLDDNNGNEVIFTLSTDRPMRNLRGLLARMENWGSDLDAVARTVAASALQFEELRFRHIDRNLLAKLDISMRHRATPRVAGDTRSGVDKPGTGSGQAGSAKPGSGRSGPPMVPIWLQQADNDPLAADVMSDVGSKISAIFDPGRESPPAPEASPEPVSAPAPSAVDVLSREPEPATPMPGPDSVDTVAERAVTAYEAESLPWIENEPVPTSDAGRPHADTQDPDGEDKTVPDTEDQRTVARDTSTRGTDSRVTRAEPDSVVPDSPASPLAALVVAETAAVSGTRAEPVPELESTRVQAQQAVEQAVEPVPARQSDSATATATATATVAEPNPADWFSPDSESRDLALEPTWSAVLITTPNGSETGLVVDSEGAVLTSWHLVKGYRSVSLLVRQQSSTEPQVYNARIVHTDKYRDLALLQVQSLRGSLVPLTLGGEGGLIRGDALQFVGHSQASDWVSMPAVLDRQSPAFAWYAGDNIIHRASVVIADTGEPALPGGALLNRNAEWIGMTIAATGDRLHHYAVSANAIREFLSAASADD